MARSTSISFFLGVLFAVAITVYGEIIGSAYIAPLVAVSVFGIVRELLSGEE